MPIYEYQCQSCDTEFETFVRKRNAEPEACPECEAEEIERLISNTSFKLKGSGWYETDYADDDGDSSGTSNGDSNGAAADAPSDSPSEAGDAADGATASESSSEEGTSTSQETDAA